MSSLSLSMFVGDNTDDPGSPTPVRVYWHPEASKPAVTASVTSRSELVKKGTVLEVEKYIREIVGQANTPTEVFYSEKTHPLLMNSLDSNWLKGFLQMMFRWPSVTRLAGM